ncbi:MAG: patatin-like phospholipase family protein [Anaerolineales bacterium]|nr:patatin-like phospholipase family protein [Anaerolineales bacterium]
MDITLALGGGGSKGNAHIGVLRILEREGFRIRAVAGTSAGGMIACIYAAGYTPDEIETEISKASKRKLYGLGSRSTPAIFGVDRIANVLKEMLGDETFDDLKIPCAVTAVDIGSRQEVVLRKGRVVDALMATIAIPGVFPPKAWGDRLLVDGGVLDPVPITVARSLMKNIPIVASVLSPAPQTWSNLPPPHILKTPLVLEPITRLRVAQAFELFLRSLDIGQRMLTELRLEVDKPDVIIRPDVAEIGVLDKVNVAEVVKLGEIAAEKALPDLYHAVSWKGKMLRRLGFRVPR